MYRPGRRNEGDGHHEISQLWQNPDHNLLSCHRPNPVELIYCAALDCAAVLHPGRTACDACRAAIPVNARYCPDCGHPTGYRSESEGFTDR